MLPTIVLGALLALPYVWYARKSRGMFAVGLIVAAAIYIVFALFAANLRHAAVGLGGVVLFAAIAAGGLRWSRYLLAFGWLAHAGWDLRYADYAPWWYPALCIGFDILVAAFIAVDGKRGRP